MGERDYYEILGVDKNSAPKQIKEAYRKLAFQYHPDKNRGNPSALEKMKEINEAYAVLSDPKKRSQYDSLRQAYGPFAYDRFRQNYSEQDIFRGSDINQIFEEMARAFGLRDFDEIFKESYGNSYRTFEFRRPGIFGRGFIYFGSGSRKGERRDSQIEIPKFSEIFPGHLGKLTKYLLKNILGIKEASRGTDLYDIITFDPQEVQKGGKFKYHHKIRMKEIVITIPQALREGQKIRLRGMGAEGKEGGEPGDLYLKVKFRKPLLQKVRELLKNW